MSTIQVAMQGMGYLRAKQRASCSNCTKVEANYADRAPPFDTCTLRCKPGGFVTTALAICDQHEATNGSGVKR